MFPTFKRSSILVLIVACWACSGAAADPGAAREAAIEKLGGKLEYRDQAKREVVKVNLSRTKVADADLIHLQEMTALESLDLYDTTVGDAGLEHLKGLKKLRFLMLKRTNVTDAGVEKLKKALPNCETISYSPRTPPPLPATFVGKWSIEFANGVEESCEIRADGTASVVEPRRSSKGLAAFQGKALVVAFDDDRVERWSLVGKRMVVEHWPQSNPLWAGHPPLRPVPTSVPVLGIGGRAP